MGEVCSTAGQSEALNPASVRYGTTYPCPIFRHQDVLAANIFFALCILCLPGPSRFPFGSFPGPPFFPSQHTLDPGSKTLHRPLLTFVSTSAHFLSRVSLFSSWAIDLHCITSHSHHSPGFA